MDIIKGLNPEQAAAVQHMKGPLLLLAGAGSGKTRVLTHRIAYMIQHNVNPYNILAVTFTNKAANEMKERVNRLLPQGGEGLWIGTFHSICVRILRREIEKLGYKSNFVIYDTDDQLTVIKQVLKDLDIDPKKYNPKMILGAISNAKNELIDAETYAAQIGGFFETMVAKVYQPYQKLLLENNAVDFDDIIMATVRLFSDHEMVLSYYQDKFQYILVDEYQDTNHAQYALVGLLAKRHRNLCVVGDPDQSIYGFRGADIQNILDFEQDYPDATVIKLEQNYRSTEYILDAAHHVIVKNVGRKEKRLWTAKGKGEPLNLFQASSDREEAQYIASEIHELRRQYGYDYSDFALLYRTNAQSRSLEEALMKFRIPYKVVGGLKFYDRMEIRDTLAYLRLIYNPSDDVAFARVINRPRRGIGDTSVERLAQFAAYEGISLYEAASKVSQISAIRGKANQGLFAFYQMIARMRQRSEELKVTDLTKEVLESSGYLKELENEGTIEAQTRIENIQELFSVMEEYIRSGQGYTLGSFLEDVALTSDMDAVDDVETGVYLMTLHTVKGLEFPVVFLTGMEEMVFPHSRALEDESEMEEERRLCYVGITRAMERLYLTFAYSRMLFGQFKNNPPSRFIGDIPPEIFGEDALEIGEEDDDDFWNDDFRSTNRSSNHPSAESRFAHPTTAQLSTQPSSPNGRGATPTSPEGSRPTWESKAQAQIIANAPAGGNKVGSFAGGEKVRHPKFGMGTVVGVRGEGEKQELDIVFPGVGLKKLLLEYAQLERV